MKKRFFLRMTFVVFASFLCVSMMINNYAMAEQSRSAYLGREGACLSDSNGRGNLASVSWACGIASSKAINVCASWIGASTGENASKTNDIYAELSVSEVNSGTTVTAGLYGMCTAVADTARRVWTNPSGIIKFGSSDETSSFTRSGTWGSPSSREVTVDVSKFISGISPEVSGDYYIYRRSIVLWREHSVGGSTHSERTTISLYLKKPTPPPGGSDPTPDIPVPTPTCESDGPRTYTGERYSGDVSISVYANNQRTGSRSGDTIWARPDDRIVWDNDYRATTPGAAYKKVSEVSASGTTIYKGYTDLSDSMCQPYGGLCSKRLPVENKNLKDILVNKGYSWRNQFATIYSWNSNEDTHSYGDTQNINGTNGNSSAQESKTIDRAQDVGQTLTETAKAGTYTNGGSSSSIFGGGDFLLGDGTFLVGQGEKNGLPSRIRIDYNNPTKTAKNQVCEIKEGTPQRYGVTAEGNEEWWLLDEDPPAGKYVYMISVPTYYTDCYNKECTNSYSDAITKATVEMEEIVDSASVKVPYNYENTTSVELGSSVAYAGETINVRDVKINVGTTYNYMTRDTYATKVPFVKAKLFAFASTRDYTGTGTMTNSGGENGCNVIRGYASVANGQCKEFNSNEYDGEGKSKLALVNGTWQWVKNCVFNCEGSLSGKAESLNGFSKDYNAYDVAAGDYMCFVSAVFPARSFDTQTEDIPNWKHGNGYWSYSAPECVVIAKRPTFQVWGGDVYSVNNIKATPAAKNNIYMDYTWPSGTFNSTRFNTERRNTTYFGSWSEQGITIRDGVTGTVASGAATGYARPNYVVKAGNTGTFCKERVPLTFANYPCTLGEVGRSTIPSGVSDNREDLLKYWLGNNLGETVEKIKNSERNNWTEITTDGGSRVEYIHVGADYTISDNIIAKGSTRLLISDGSINIIENLTIPSGLTNSKEIPKLIILADNINIRCTVDEIDAILITRKNGTVNTCINATKDNDNDVKRSNQLKIFGTVITDMLVLGRTYGGGATEKLEAISTDAETRGVPNEDRAAEIFDFDPTILLWGEAKSSTAETSTLQETHQRELAPRY